MSTIERRTFLRTAGAASISELVGTLRLPATDSQPPIPRHDATEVKAQ